MNINPCQELLNEVEFGNVLHYIEDESSTFTQKRLIILNCCKLTMEAYKLNDRTKPLFTVVIDKAIDYAYRNIPVNRISNLKAYKTLISENINLHESLYNELEHLIFHIAREQFHASYISAERIYADCMNISRREVRVKFMDVINDILGNPYKERTLIDSAIKQWQDGAIIALAKSIDDNKDWDALPVLADMLEEAGYTNTETLNHLRNINRHYKGCWAVSLILED